MSFPSYSAFAASNEFSTIILLIINLYFNSFGQPTRSNIAEQDAAIYYAASVSDTFYAKRALTPFTATDRIISTDSNDLASHSADDPSENSSYSKAPSHNICPITDLLTGLTPLSSQIAGTGESFVDVKGIGTAIHLQGRLLEKEQNFSKAIHDKTIRTATFADDTSKDTFNINDEYIDSSSHHHYKEGVDDNELNLKRSVAFTDETKQDAHPFTSVESALQTNNGIRRVREGIVHDIAKVLK
ncbi:uncharacterized protein ASCRUDRAFT_8757 [Ascoidea rubescens DSM 1968]|uniref:Uncharacterized protein n=1 Tax=Ascoidea rubescens DSM 1968 TaxID=1344418 RepID=A0A1D2VFZ5_9ASCO|nr:hypothetical protein ASCRUDRAFT_8757 [Ascoidea rubescens DSM 1968]ODV60556.1 hypothetical protein ASCRUDRAFT_8757 [Ascoidea rubescens DSM 1968]